MEPPDLSSDATMARQTAKTVTIATAALSAVTGLGWYPDGSSTYMQWAGVTAIATIAAVFVQSYRRIPTALSVALTILTLSLGLAANVLTNFQAANRGIHFSPFETFKIASIATAVIAPTPLWLGYGVVVFCGLAPIALYYGLFTPELRTFFPAQEPWIGLIYAGAAFFALRHHLRGIQLERTLERIRAERRAVDDLARLFVGLRDLTNTPLQTLELTSFLLKNEQLNPIEGSQHLDRSLVHLHELNTIFSLYEKEVNWLKTDASFDAISMLQQRLIEIRRRPEISTRHHPFKKD